jgi:hypothetical protein
MDEIMRQLFFCVTLLKLHVNIFSLWAGGTKEGNIRPLNSQQPIEWSFLNSKQPIGWSFLPVWYTDFPFTLVQWSNCRWHTVLLRVYYIFNSNYLYVNSSYSIRYKRVSKRDNNSVYFLYSFVSVEESSETKILNFRYCKFNLDFFYIKFSFTHIFWVTTVMLGLHGVVRS